MFRGRKNKASRKEDSKRILVDLTEYKTTKCCGISYYNPFVQFYYYMRKMIIIYGWPLVFMIISVMFGVKGAMIGLVGSSGLPYAQKYLKLTAIEMQKYGIVASFPWTVKPLIGMVSDGFPILGYNKRWYIAASSLVGSCAIYFVATYKFDRSNGLYYIAGLTLINAQVAIADLLTEGKYAEAMRYNPNHSASMVSYVWGNITLGGILATVLSYIALKDENYHLLFWMALPFAVQCFLTSASGLLPELKVKRTKKGEVVVDDGEDDDEDDEVDAMGVGDAKKSVTFADEDEETKKANRQKRSMNMMAILMGVICVIIAGIQIVGLDESTILGITLISCVLLSMLIFFFLPRQLAKATFFLFITSVLSVSFGGAMTYWFTVDEKCNPGGPHFDYVYFTVYTSIVGQCSGIIGIWLFNIFFSKGSLRKAFWISSVISSLGSFFDYAIVKRWNVDYLSIPDKAFYMFGDAVLESIVGMMAYMPSVVLIAKMCPKNLETTMFAILASFANLGGSLSGSFGTFAMDYAGIKTDLTSGSCNWDNLPNLILVCGICMPLLAIPLTFIFVPNILMTDTITDFDNSSTKVGDKHVTEDEKKSLIK
jgi:folate/biopterin transporter